MEENSSKLDQVVRRPETSRQSHPRVEELVTISNYDDGVTDVGDANSVAKRTCFYTDNQVIKSISYRGAMVRYTMSALKTISVDMEEPEVVETEADKEDTTEIDTSFLK